MKKSPIVEAVKKVSPAVVSIIIARQLPKIESLPFGLWPFFPEGFDPSELYKQIPPEMFDEQGRVKIGGGSGFIVSKDGIVMTNKHVVVDAQADYTVVMNDGRKLSAKVVARDPINDVAILKISDDHNFPTVELADSSELELGESVIAIGNALGQFQNTVSTGIVSGLSRHITAQAGLGRSEELRGVIQTDAAINPGNSGGPLVDIEGKAIGINSAVVFGAQNIGFAIPINAAKKALEDIKKYGRIRAPFLGLRYILLDEVLKQRHNLPVGYGAMVVPEATPGDYGVIPEGPADKAGVKEHDIILELDDHKITRENPLQDLIQKKEIGNSIKLKIFRKGKEIELTATLEEMQTHSKK